MLKKIAAWPWGQAALWVAGIFAMLVGAGSDYGPNWGSIAVGAVFITAAIALGFLRLQRQSLERSTASNAVEPAPLQAQHPRPKTDDVAEHSASSGVPRQFPPLGEREPTESRKGGFWRGFASLLVFVVVAGGVRFAIEYYQSPEQQLARMSDQELVEQFERDVFANNDFGATFLRMKRHFPFEYDQLMGRLVRLAREGASEDRAFVVGRDFMANFFAENRTTMRKGSDESLSAFLDSQVRLLEAVRSFDPQSCADVIDTGRFEPTTGRALLPTTSAALIAANNAMFDAIMSGDAQPTERAAITEAEWLAVLERAQALGADATVLSVMGTAEFSQIEPQRRCDSVTILFQAMNELDMTQRARFAAEMMSP